MNDFGTSPSRCLAPIVVTYPQRMLRTKLMAASLVLALVAAACGSDTSETSQAATGAQAESGAAESTALDITATAADGSTIELATYAGEDLMLWFWAPW